MRVQAVSSSPVIVDREEKEEKIERSLRISLK
jgi:hypothetical protein